MNDLNTTQIGTETATEIAGEPEKKPLTIEQALQAELIQGVMLAFPGLSQMIRAIQIARKENLNIILPLIFSADGRVMIQEPIIQKNAPAQPAADGAGNAPKTEGEAND